MGCRLCQNPKTVDVMKWSRRYKRVDVIKVDVLKRSRRYEGAVCVKITSSCSSKNQSMFTQSTLLILPKTVDILYKQQSML